MTQTELTPTASLTGKWKHYPAYKDSGVEWLGEIPACWKVERLKFNSYIKGRIGWQNLRSDEFTVEGPYLITGMHFNEGSIDWDACYHITEERYEVAPEIQVKEHDVLITKDGSIGKVAYIKYLPRKASLNSHLLESIS
jgi:type I restriction enzyme, S subunit